LTPTSGTPPSGGEEGPEPGLRNPARAAQETLHTPASATVALSQEAVCVATTGRIRRTSTGTLGGELAIYERNQWTDGEIGPREIAESLHGDVPGDGWHEPCPSPSSSDSRASGEEIWEAGSMASRER
jgi:hypothetical protein